MSQWLSDAPGMSSLIPAESLMCPASKRTVSYIVLPPQPGVFCVLTFTEAMSGNARGDPKLSFVTLRQLGRPLHAEIGVKNRNSGTTFNKTCNTGSE